MFNRVIITLITLLYFSNLIYSQDTLAIIIDGEKDDFYNSLTGPDDGYLQIRSFAFSDNGAPTDDTDLSAKVWTAWDTTWFYLYTEITDDIIKNTNEFAYFNDCLEVKVDAKLNSSIDNTLFDARLTAIDSSESEFTTDELSTIPDSSKEYVRKKTLNGYVLEFKAKWDVLGGTQGVSVTENSKFGMAILVHDNDNTERDASVQWSAVLLDNVWNTVASHGTVTFLPDHKLNFEAKNAMTGVTNPIPYDGSDYNIDFLTIPDGRRLREIVEERFSDGSILIGATTGSWAFGQAVGTIMDREFDYVTPENDFKQWNIHGDNSNNWNWTETDAWAQHIVENNQVLRIHGPIGPQCSDWTQNDSRTAVELEKNMNDFLPALCQRYNGKPGIISMDVVNETVLNGTWHKNKPGTGGWECPWYIIGQDTDVNKTPLYIKRAFEIANTYAPDLKLIFNHHDGPEKTADWNLIKKTITYLRDLGLRVDGIGWQAHVDNGWATSTNLNHLKSLVDWAHQNDLEFHVTEASVWLRNGASETILVQQGYTYASILDVLLEKRYNGVVGWNTWHIDDGSGWQNELLPSLFDSNFNAKPAYYAIQSSLENAITAVKNEKSVIPKDVQLYQNYPNPFNPSTIISFSIPKSEHVTISIYNVLGEKMDDIIDKVMESGSYNINYSSDELSSGIYFYSITSGGNRITKKMILQK